MALRLSCGIQTTRFTLLGLNVLFFVFSFALLGFGIYLKVSRKFDVALSEHINAQVIGSDGIATVGVILIIVSIFTMFLSLFGFLGACLRKQIFLYLYAIILSLLLVLELVAFIIAMSSRVRIRDSYEDALRSVFTKAYNSTDPNLAKYFEELEVEFKCCGIKGKEDYKNIDKDIPNSCHKDKSKDKDVFDKGCAEAIIDWIWDELPVIGSIIAVVFVIEVFGVIASISLAVAISHYTYGEKFAKL